MCWVFIFCVALLGCASTFWTKNHYPHLNEIGLEKDANSWAQSLKTLQNYSKSSAERSNPKRSNYDGSLYDEKYGSALNWSQKEILERGEAIAVRGIQTSYLKDGELVHISWNAPDIENIFDRPADLKNYITYAQTVVIGKAIARRDSSMIFDIDILHYLKGLPSEEGFSVTNAPQGHIGSVTDDMSHTLSDGMLCLFFPSEKYSTYRKAFPLSEFRNDDETLRFEVFPRMCEQEDGRFSFSQSGLNEDVLYKQDVLKLAPPIVKDDIRPKGLPLANSIMAINSWDILTVNGYRFPYPLASLDIATGHHIRDLQMICGPNLFTGQIIKGKYIRDWPGAADTSERCKESLPGTLGYYFSKNYLTGKFYGDRHTLYFDSPDLYFIAKRADRGPRQYGWGELYKMNSIEKCLLDHTGVGVDNYAGYGFVRSYPNHRVSIYLTEDGAKQWDTCKPKFPLEVTVVKHSLLFLIEKTDEINRRLMNIDSVKLRRANMDISSNAIALFVEPSWADEHREEFEKLKQEHSYLVVREEEPDVVVLTSQ